MYLSFNDAYIFQALQIFIPLLPVVSFWPQFLKKQRMLAKEKDATCSCLKSK